VEAEPRDLLGGGPGDGLDALDLELEQGLEDRLPPGVAPEDALAELIGEQQLAQLLEEQAQEQIRDELLTSLGPDTADELAAIDPDQLDPDLLERVGYPTDELGPAALDLVALVGDLRDLGWQDGSLGPDADPDAVFDRVEREAGDDLALVLAGDRDVALAIVPTQAGEQGAQRLAEGLLDAADPLVRAGAEVMVVSEQLVVEETLDLLVDAQVEKILFSLGAALALLVVFYLLSQRRPMLGVITMVPTLLAVPIVLGSMWILGLPFNALTATIASVAIGFGVDYGIHLSNRFREERTRSATPEAAVRDTVSHTGAALAGSAATTIAAFGVLLLSDLAPVAQFGAITAMTMFAALVTTVLAQSSCLLLWERHHRRRADASPATAGAVASRPDPGQPNSSISSATEATIRDGR
jgi:preprotein translocase subunit SecF